MSQTQQQNSNSTEIKKKINAVKPVQGTFQKNRAKLATMLKANRKNTKAK